MYKNLKKFLEKDMRMSHIYQPVMIKTLLKHKGSAEISRIAQDLLSYDTSQKEYYELVTKNMVGKVLTKNRKITSKEGSKYCLDGFDKLSKDQQKELSGKIKEVTGGVGANVIYDPVGSHYSEPALRAIAWEGRYLVIGFAAGDIPKIPLNLALLKGCQIVGVFWGAWTGIDPAGNKANFMELFKLHGEGKIAPEVSDKFTLDNAADAIAHLQNRKAKGKVIITI